jgi:hypothetical protein
LHLGFDYEFGNTYWVEGYGAESRLDSEERPFVSNVIVVFFIKERPGKRGVASLFAVQ